VLDSFDPQPLLVRSQIFRTQNLPNSRTENGQAIDLRGKVLLDRFSRDGMRVAAFLWKNSLLGG
jgi:hypothetical protein